MNHYWEDATKRIQEELNDPMLRVEFNPKNQSYEVLKWIPNYITYSMPGALVGSDNPLVNLSFSTGRWSFQMSCKEWDDRIFQRMRQSRLENTELKYLFDSRKRERDKVATRQQNQVRDACRDTAKDLWGLEHPKVFSHS